MDENIYTSEITTIPEAEDTKPKWLNKKIIIPVAAAVLIIIIAIIIVVANRQPRRVGGLIKTDTTVKYSSKNGDYICEPGWAVVERNGIRCKAQTNYKVKTVEDKIDGDYSVGEFVVNRFCGNERIVFSTFENYLESNMKLDKTAFDCGLSGAEICVSYCPLPRGYEYDYVRSSKTMGFGKEGADYFNNIYVDVEYYEPNEYAAIYFEIGISAGGNDTEYKGFAFLDLKNSQN